MKFVEENKILGMENLTNFRLFLTKEKGAKRLRKEVKRKYHRLGVDKETNSDGSGKQGVKEGKPVKCIRIRYLPPVFPFTLVVCKISS